ncbi:hypothetical protein HanXRQr2_Chr12g0549021 [Helianthus annuus]|uniref:Uncharacterized protein n=1 Tax=Helianthus annuus TaxID=4232 RepID=A0A9K3MX29_HELAN|nr:hypothetical protein HanXRQr2_Chr12g0549021 [Helianthus annuus]KAJ0863319.1 hypothetical protein HanPSC8_Chr12g0528581 [Helianthus annuus]
MGNSNRGGTTRGSGGFVDPPTTETSIIASIYQSWVLYTLTP